MSRRNSLIDPSTISATGPGLSGGRVGEECKFRIEGTDGGLALSFHIEGPSKPIFETSTCEALALDITYIPILPGEYKLSLMWYGKHIEGSPYVFYVEGDGPMPTVEDLVGKIKIKGRGLDNPKSQEYNEILIDCRRVYLKDHKLRCSVKAPSRCAAMVKLQDNHDGTYSMHYKPTFPGTYTVFIRVDDIHIQGSPFTVHVRT